MSKARFVFFSAANGAIDVTIDNALVGSAVCSEELVAILRQQGVTLEDEMFHSSSVDFAAEEGFEDDNGAYNIIEPALEILIDN
jgi:hypothetical protein